MDGETLGVGSRVGDYQIQNRIGAGGMGEVYLVQHPRLPRLDALKLLDATVSRNAQFSRRFQREADLLAPLRHPNVITIHDRGVHEGRLWLTMEYVDGLDAARLLTSQGPLPLELAVAIIGGAGAALDYAYGEYGITHRDVKPANILVEFDRNRRLKTVKLADFGIAKAAGESTSLTSTGVTIGTMSYIAPEAIEGRELDNRADVYSLGCSAFELLTGTPPYAATTIPALMMAHIAQPIPSITERNRALPKHLDSVFARVLAKDPAQRYQTCEDFVGALRGTASEELPKAASVPFAVGHGSAGQPWPWPSSESRESDPARAVISPKSPLAVAAYAMTLLLVVAAVVWLVTSRGDSRSTPVAPVTTSAAASTTTTTPPTTTTPTDPTGAEINRAAVEQWLGGWNGTVSQPASQTPVYTVQLQLEHDGRTVVGTIVYPELSCSGRLDHAALSGNVLTLQENITVNTRGKCVTPSTLTLMLRPNEIGYGFGNDGGGQATLNRT
ncbi:serine/threonine-protein kinase [Mycolicibacterium brumae]|uniref:non-specific serine/threonine protein kinase n=1 Tax=Mycolicibacterium brumae TaxID=85968 RepID=A0A2G5P825_9MYCO|nr:serine/threonine-protein kinase [Mycolicibacterium brumae]MCV7194103.1 serine/threonine protein kinase [Mycolicibacterium brumae]PIB74417.1 serine/threonine protein kinase [Mycolicibacterium brumae]RWA22724.1 hypothetical protein MBRU_12300 [Mycolicibacterium brumae DSM 44177]UWW07470.1 serine/threonine protein kinase [Mycolicibacterium brumae]